MKKTSYSEKLKHPLWQKKRLEILKRDKFKCKLCEDTETTLNVHHKEYIPGNYPWEYNNSSLITLCEHCHEEVELLKKEGIDFDNIKILKFNNWNDGSRIMLGVHPGVCSLRILSKDNEFKVGYDLCGHQLLSIIKILKKA